AAESDCVVGLSCIRDSLRTSPTGGLTPVPCRAMRICLRLCSMEKVVRSTPMRKTLLAATLASAVAASLAMTPAMADDADKATPARAESGQSDRSMGEAVDDAAIVAKVKSGLLSSSDVEGLDVNVDARNGVV